MARFWSSGSFTLEPQTMLVCWKQRRPNMPGMGELIVILLIVMVVFGANKLPGIGDALGRSIKNFKRASKVEDDEEKDAPEDKAAAKKQLATKPAKQLAAEKDAAADEDEEWEEVVVRRKKKKNDAASAEG
jgi:sec-independent protein translocase protein TatA